PSVDGASSPSPVADVIRIGGGDTSNARISVFTGCSPAVTMARRTYLPAGSARICMTPENSTRPSPAGRAGTSALRIAGDLSSDATSYLTFIDFASAPYA